MFAEVAAASAAVRESSGRKAKVALLAGALRRLTPEEIAPGAAYLAGLAVGYWESRDDITRNWAVDATFNPARPQSEMNALRGDWDRALERAKGWEKSG